MIFLLFLALTKAYLLDGGHAALGGPSNCRVCFQRDDKCCYSSSDRDYYCCSDSEFEVNVANVPQPESGKHVLSNGVPCQRVHHSVCPSVCQSYADDSCCPVGQVFFEVVAGELEYHCCPFEVRGNSCPDLNSRNEEEKVGTVAGNAALGGPSNCRVCFQRDDKCCYSKSDRDYYCCSDSEFEADVGNALPTAGAKLGSSSDCPLWEAVCEYVYDEILEVDWISKISQCTVPDSKKPRACSTSDFNEYGYDDCKTMLGLPFTVACLNWMETGGMWMLDQCKYESYSQCPY